MKSLAGMETGKDCAGSSGYVFFRLTGLLTGKGTGKVHAGSSELAKQSSSPARRPVRDRYAGLKTKIQIRRFKCILYTSLMHLSECA